MSNDVVRKKDSKSGAELGGDGRFKVANAEGVICFNKDQEGRCMAYSEGRCHKDCEARIPTLEKKAELLRSLLNYANSQDAKYSLSQELSEVEALVAEKEKGKYDDWSSCYFEDRRRGSGGGSSEHDSNRSTGMKTLLKDNRSVGVKPTKSQLEEYQKELRKWEEDNEKLPKLSRSSLGKSKVDTYLEEDSQT